MKFNRIIWFSCQLNRISIKLKLHEILRSRSNWIPKSSKAKLYTKILWMMFHVCPMWNCEISAIYPRHEFRAARNQTWQINIRLDLNNSEACSILVGARRIPRFVSSIGAERNERRSCTLSSRLPSVYTSSRLLGPRREVAGVAASWNLSHGFS